MSGLKIQFPEDFETRYNVYKTKLLGLTVSMPQLSSKKYSDVKEPIELKSLGLKISDRCIYKVSNKNEKSKINNTEKCLIYFLYYKAIENTDECFQIDRLVSEMGAEIGKKSHGYIKNLIGEVNKSVRELVVKGKTNIGNFIVYEKNRGYRLNPELLIQITNVSQK